MIKKILLKIYSVCVFLILIYIGFIIIVAMFVCSMFLISDYIHKPQLKPSKEYNDIWINNYENIYFTVENDDFFGKVKTETDSIDIRIHFGKERNCNIYIESKGNINNSYESILYGKCKFRENMFIVTVKGSDIDGIKEGDKITFNSVDKLPEWATQTLGDSSS